jgi:hypothetical protein
LIITPYGRSRGVLKHIHSYVLGSHCGRAQFDDFLFFHIQLELLICDHTLEDFYFGGETVNYGIHDHFLLFYHGDLIVYGGLRDLRRIIH